MVFGSVPVFLDPPNWPQQEQNQHPHHEGNNGNIITGHEVFHHQQLPPLPQNPNPNPNHHASGGIPARSGCGGSMSERARLAKIPQPEGSLKCPRCESTNTKFCYFNNYSLTQPRHFCKTCRRYWTRGGALRNVPVGGGCRRNTRKGKNGNSSKQNSNGQASSKQITANSSVMSEGMVSNIGQTNSQFPFMATLQNLSQFGNNIGLNLTGIGTTNGNVHSSLMNDLGFLQVGAGSNNNNSINQFALFDPANIGLYPFNSDRNGTFGSTARVSQTAPVKMEENNLLNLSRHVSGFNSSENNNNNPFWVGAPDFSGINNSSSNNQIL